MSPETPGFRPKTCPPPVFLPDAPPRRYTESEIQEKVATFRMMLLEKDVALGKEGEQPDPNQKPT